MKLLQNSLALLGAVAAFVGGVLLSTSAPAAAASSAYGCDYSYSRPSIYTLDHPNQGAGVWCRFTARYLYSGGKGLTAAEARYLHANGRDIVLNYESTGRTVTGGYSAGVRDARAAAAFRARVGAPSSTPIIFSVDFDERNTAQVVAYLNGAASVLGRAQVGVYGSYRVVNAACAAGYAGRNWQAYAWSRGQWASPSCAPLRQIRNGIAHGSMDLDVQVAAYPMWGPNSPVVFGPAPSSAPAASRPTPARRKAAVHRAPVRHSSAVYVTVHRGDTVGRIASRYHTTVRKVAALNHLRSVNRVYAGQRLRVR